MCCIETFREFSAADGKEGNMVLNVHRNHKAYKKGGEGGEGRGYGGGGKREIIYLSLHCHHQNDLH